MVKVKIRTIPARIIEIYRFKSISIQFFFQVGIKLLLYAKEYVQCMYVELNMSTSIIQICPATLNRISQFYAVMQFN